jgi:class 3 adenylate cyclase
LNLPGEVDELSELYLKYMRETQDIARETMMKYLDKEQRGSAVIKSTGDGFMIAAKLADIVDNALADATALQRAQTITWALLEGLRDLVDAAKPKGTADDTFAGKTFRLIKDKGPFLGIAWEDYIKSKADLYVAGGIALGTGFFSEKKTPVATAGPAEGDRTARTGKQGRRTVETTIFVERDAFGHAANLAFRLCDKAGREKEKTPPILLDRRVGKLVQPKLRQEAERKAHTYELRAYRAALDLKGIEENWCMSYEEAEKNT